MAAQRHEVQELDENSPSTCVPSKSRTMARLHPLIRVAPSGQSYSDMMSPG
jgi:hypothetical protein